MLIGAQCPAIEPTSQPQGQDARGEAYNEIAEEGPAADVAEAEKIELKVRFGQRIAETAPAGVHLRRRAEQLLGLRQTVETATGGQHPGPQVVVLK